MTRKDAAEQKGLDDYGIVFISGEIDQATAHQACLLAAAESPDGPLTADILDRAIHRVRETSHHQEHLFG